MIISNGTNIFILRIILASRMNKILHYPIILNDDTTYPLNIDDTTITDKKVKLQQQIHYFSSKDS